MERFFPWVTPGISFHRRDGLAQAVPAGTISNAHFESWSPGANLAAQTDLGDAIYKALAARQLVKASNHALETERQDAILSAAKAYFDLSKAKGLAEVATAALKTSQEYGQQLHEAVGAGIAFKGDELRIQTQTADFIQQRAQFIHRVIVVLFDRDFLIGANHLVDLAGKGFALVFELPDSIGHAFVLRFETFQVLALQAEHLVFETDDLLPERAASLYLVFGEFELVRQHILQIIRVSRGGIFDMALPLADEFFQFFIMAGDFRGQRLDLFVTDERLHVVLMCLELVKESEVLIVFGEKRRDIRLICRRA